MKTTTFGLRTDDGLLLQGTRVVPEGTLRGQVVCVHGFGEHHRRHDLLAITLASQGYVTVRYDHRGHGLSGGPRGDSPGHDSLLNDLDRVLDDARKTAPALPTFLYGHSLGGGIVAHWAVRSPPLNIRGIVLSSPWLRLCRQPSWFVQWLGRGVATVWPTLAIKTGIRAENLASDPESIAKYRGDPLIVKKISLRMVLAAIQAGEFTMQNAARCALPVLAMHGTADRITSVEATKRFAATAPRTDLKLFDGLAHEMHFEPRAPEVMQTMVDWLDNQLTSVAPESPGQ